MSESGSLIEQFKEKLNKEQRDDFQRVTYHCKEVKHAEERINDRTKLLNKLDEI